VSLESPDSPELNDFELAWQLHRLHTRARLLDDAIAAMDALGRDLVRDLVRDKRAGRLPLSADSVDSAVV
jgi:hypothetical protein